MSGGGWEYVEAKRRNQQQGGKKTVPTPEAPPAPMPKGLAPTTMYSKFDAEQERRRRRDAGEDSDSEDSSGSGSGAAEAAAKGKSRKGPAAPLTAKQSRTALADRLASFSASDLRHYCNMARERFPHSIEGQVQEVASLLETYLAATAPWRGFNALARSDKSPAAFGAAVLAPLRELSAEHITVLTRLAAQLGDRERSSLLLWLQTALVAIMHEQDDGKGESSGNGLRMVMQVVIRTGSVEAFTRIASLIAPLTAPGWSEANRARAERCHAYWLAAQFLAVSPRAGLAVWCQTLGKRVLETGAHGKQPSNSPWPAMVDRFIDRALAGGVAVPDGGAAGAVAVLGQGQAAAAFVRLGAADDDAERLRWAGLLAAAVGGDGDATRAHVAALVEAVGSPDAVVSEVALTVMRLGAHAAPEDVFHALGAEPVRQFAAVSAALEAMEADWEGWAGNATWLPLMAACLRAVDEAWTAAAAKLEPARLQEARARVAALRLRTQRRIDGGCSRVTKLILLTAFGAAGAAAIWNLYLSKQITWPAK